MVFRIHIRRDASNVDPNTIIESWNNNAPTGDRRDQLSSIITKQIGNGISKKDVLMSRSRGAVGMPFSVLYMNPHSLRGNHANKKISSKDHKRT